MKLSGLQKTTILDFPGKVACTVFTAGCQFRCPFCHNASLVNVGETTQILPEEEFFAFLTKRRGVLDGVCVSGGEPLLHSDIGEFLRRIKGMGYAIKLDTNGGYPARLKALVTEGLLDYVAMDIKHTPEQYETAVGLPNFDPAPILESAAFLMEGAVPYEFRCTVVDGIHQPADFARIGEWIQGSPRFFLQRFADSGDMLTEGLCALSEEDMEAARAAVAPWVGEVAVR
ncbi:anaerobic ribonucleoside-triphosphate reductase activating protein [Ruminococcaceae bacterium OttesenSCG-928-L11]|nr:anaerobic ribonucleoside-triphosphate reductase activating protein [Ruminococcaceae bacterium OttesenSCG-928-L11]